MQQTRRHILEILKERKEATIDEIVTALSDRIGKITAVTVRHHLEILRGDGLVAAPTVRRRSAPGRPQYVYTLTEQAADHFPNNYQGLASGLLDEIKSILPPAQVSEILEGVAHTMAEDAMIPDGPLTVRLDHAVAYLNSCGYSAEWSANGDGHTLRVGNCPYERMACDNRELCKMDETLVTDLVGARPRRVAWRQEDGETCTYHFDDDD
jgi:predicted ArsR family transcriptional regulator